MKTTALATFGLALAIAAGSAYAADAPANTATTTGGHHWFSKGDTNGDHMITKDEWRAKGDQMFKDIDTNNDGKISPEEMKAHREKMHEKYGDYRNEHHGAGGSNAPATNPADAK